MFETLLQFVLCAAVIVVAGSFLTRFADAIAEITKLGRLLVGSLLLAGATSLPEITVDVSAIRMGMPDLAVGDLLGSSLMNLLILAVLDLSHHSRGKMLSQQAAAHALSGSMSATLTALAALGVLTGKAWAEYTLFNVGPISILLAFAYAFGVRIIYLDRRIAAQDPSEHPSLESTVPSDMTLKKALLGFAISAVAILIAGPYLASAAGTLAEITGLGGTFVGSTLVALTTSLPEVASSIAALRIGAMDLAIGNIFGSNAYNILILVPLDVLHPQSLFAVVSPEHGITCVAVILATLTAIMGQLYHVESRVKLVDPDAWLVISIVFGALALLYYLPA